MASLPANKDIIALASAVTAANQKVESLGEIIARLPTTGIRYAPALEQAEADLARLCDMLRDNVRSEIVEHDAFEGAMSDCEASIDAKFDALRAAIG